MLIDLIPSSRERLATFILLREQGVLVQKPSGRGIPQYRIRVPLLAESIKFDAEELQYRAKVELQDIVRKNNT